MSRDTKMRAEIKQQVYQMYGSADALELLNGANLASIRLRQFADRLNEILDA